MLSKRAKNLEIAGKKIDGIIEVRDGFIKLETSCDLALSSFLEVKDVDKTYIAQVQQIKKAGDIIIAYAKLQNP